LALSFLGKLVEQGLGAGGLLAVDDGERFGQGRIRLGRFQDGAVGGVGMAASFARPGEQSVARLPMLPGSRRGRVRPVPW
jgi:hypothetical protein